MTWAEFRIRSFAFNRQRKWEMSLFREVSYEVHTLKYMFGKKTPPTKERFWPIDKKKKRITLEQKKRIMQMQREYEKKKNGKA